MDFSLLETIETLTLDISGIDHLPSCT